MRPASHHSELPRHPPKKIAVWLIEDYLYTYTAREREKERVNRQQDESKQRAWVQSSSDPLFVGAGENEATTRAISESRHFGSILDPDLVSTDR